MYARVARWEGHSAEELRESAERANASAADGPPPGVPAKAFLMLVDADAGKSMSIVLFDSEDDLRQGDEALNAMTPPDSSSGRRVSVEHYEVAADLKV